MIVGSVCLFREEYLQNDPLFSIFISLLLSFSLSMVILIITPSLIVVLLGWDGLGVTSFLLIRYYKASSSYSARFKTYLLNRVGDSFFMLWVPILLTLSSSQFFHSYTQSRVLLSSWRLWSERIKRNSPVVTNVEECTSADTGVGAAIASGNQLLNGEWALFV